jgi:stearoyl-CoA desaturase (delta-9 desaturase)
MQTNVSVVDRLAWRWGILDPASAKRVNVRILTGMVAFHLLALLACVPWFFSWSGLASAFVGYYLCGVLGINIAYHRLLTHRGFSSPRWLEHCLAVLGACCWQGSPLTWVVIHRLHHQHADEPGDPHSPRTGFFWSHMGWFLIYDPAVYNFTLYDRYARDLFQDRFYKWIERPRVWRAIHLTHWAVFLVAGTVVGALSTWSVLGTLQLGLSWLVWGVFVRTVVHLHATWAVNSITHLWGYRNFDTRDDSRNNWLVALVSNGEGWHNNHHAEPRCAAHGRRWWELDVSYIIIRGFELVGLASDLVRPRNSQLDSGEDSRLDGPEKLRATA